VAVLHKVSQNKIITGIMPKIKPTKIGGGSKGGSSHYSQDDDDNDFGGSKHSSHSSGGGGGSGGGSSKSANVGRTLLAANTSIGQVPFQSFFASIFMHW
jgi:hypothetical protein